MFPYIAICGWENINRQLLIRSLSYEKVTDFIQSKIFTVMFSYDSIFKKIFHVYY